jgi:surfactin synthase thioesterase subunit
MKKWLLHQPAPSHKLRLFCFAYAGGNAVLFRPWQAALGPQIEVCAIQLPGRGARMIEPTYRNMQELVPVVAKVIASQNNMPFAFFGHSLGAILSFEVARYCQMHHLPLPVHLIASGTSAPQNRTPPKNLHLMPDVDLIKELGKFNGTPPEVLAHRELMEFVLPIIRADFALVETWRYQAMPLLSMPLTVFSGREDDRVNEDQVNDWQKEAGGAFDVQWFEGGHFFINTGAQAVQAAVLERLQPYLPRHG